MDRSEWAKKLKQGIIDLQRIQHIMVVKNPTYPFLYPVVENSIYTLANLLGFVEQNNPYFTTFREDYFFNRNIAMHKSFFSDLHIGVETGLREIANTRSFNIENSRQVRVNSLVERIKAKINDFTKIEGELKEILGLGSPHYSFNDYLNSVLKNIPSLGVEYIKSCRLYFDGINIARNKMSHSDMTLSESEKNKLLNAKLGKLVGSDGNFQVSFEFYKPVIEDIIRFFDMLYSHN